MGTSKGESTRDAYGRALARLAAADPRIVALDCDLGRSTRSFEITKSDPARFSEMGIAEVVLALVAASGPAAR